MSECEWLLTPILAISWPLESFDQVAGIYLKSYVSLFPKAFFFLKSLSTFRFVAPITVNAFEWG